MPLEVILWSFLSALLAMFLSGCAEESEATLETAGDGSLVRRLGGPGTYKFDLNIRAVPGVTITGDGFKGGDDSIYGCGKGDRKCQCLYPADGFRMLGYGTDGSATGLELVCRNIKFSMPGHEPSECTCTFKAMINYWGRGRDFEMQCSAQECFKLVDYKGQGLGTRHDLYGRFKNPNGGGDIADTDWEFHVQAEALGEGHSPAVRRLDGSYKFDLNIKAGPGVKITGDGFKGGDDSIFGCGAGDRKCQCLYPPGGFQMLGYGTSGTATGLEFWCRNIKFSMPGHEPSECTCAFKAMINKLGRGRDFVMQCSAKECFELVNYDGQGLGKKNDLYDRFRNPNGGGDIGDVSWEFHVQADALGEAKPKKPDVILGGWTPISSGASTTITQATTWSSTEERAELKEVSSSFTAGTTYTYSQKGGITVPGLADAKSKKSLEVSMSRTEGWKSAVTDTYSKTQGGSQTFECKPQPCEGGTSYQWQTSVLHQGQWGALFDSCVFVCMPNQGQRPKCPYGSCCSSDLKNQCSQCSTEWCDKADPECPFHDTSFKAGCDSPSPSPSPSPPSPAPPPSPSARRRRPHN